VLEQKGLRSKGKSHFYRLQKKGTRPLWGGSGHGREKGKVMNDVWRKRGTNFESRGCQGGKGGTRLPTGKNGRGPPAEGDERKYTLWGKKKKGSLIPEVTKQKKGARGRSPTV